jgi:hypothetical protein
MEMGMSDCSVEERWKRELPVFDGTVLDLFPIRGAWREHGAIECKKLLTHDEAKNLKQIVFALYDSLAHRMERGTIALDANQAFHLNEWGGICFSFLPEWCILTKSELCQLLEFAHSIGARTARALGYSHSSLRPDRSWFRRLKDTRRIPWHIDAEAADVKAPAGADCANIWLPFDTVGAGRPTIEIFSGSHRYMSSIPPSQESDRSRADAWVAEHFKVASCAPILHPGDGLVFDSYILHRTQAAPASAGERTTAELRFNWS